MKNVKNILLLSLFCIALSSCNRISLNHNRYTNYLNASGYVVKKNVRVPSFHTIKVSNRIKVFVVDNSKKDVAIEIDQAFEKYLRVRVSRGTLVLDCDRDNYVFDNRGVINVYVSNKKVKKFILSSSASVKIVDKLLSPNIHVKTSSSGRFTGDLFCENVFIEASSSSGVLLSGSAKQVVIEASSSAIVDAIDLKAESVFSESSSASKVRFNATKEQVIEASSSSIVKYLGKPAISRIDYSSAANVTEI